MVQALEGEALPPLAEGESLPLKEVELHQVGQVSLPIKSVSLRVCLASKSVSWCVCLPSNSVCPSACPCMLLQQGELGRLAGMNTVSLEQYTLGVGRPDVTSH